MIEVNIKKEGILTNLDKERNKQIEMGEMNEILDAVGQDDEKKAAKAVIELNQELEKKNKAKEERLQEYLQDKSKHLTYNMILRNLLDALCSEVDLPDGFDYRVQEDEKGVALIIKTPVGYFAKGFKPIQDGKYDLNAVKTIRDNLENTIDRVKGKLN